MVTGGKIIGGAGLTGPMAEPVAGRHGLINKLVTAINTI